MSDKKRVLVLGAGASMNYGYPSGAELRRRILKMVDEDARSQFVYGAATGLSHSLWSEFKHEFLFSQMYSIDAFLAKRTEFTEIGKRCISAILLSCEDPAALFNESSNDHWLQYFLNRVVATRDWSELDFSDFAVVTFNYDRSLEMYLHLALSAIYKRGTAEIAEKLASLEINHVYGALSKAAPGDPSFVAYNGEQISVIKVSAAADGLQVIPESREDSETLKQARATLRDALRICFLGFGFDDLNVQRLSLGEACATKVQNGGGIRLRSHCGTRLGITDAELNFGMSLMGAGGHGRIDSFFSDRCLPTLRQTGFLL